MEEAIEIAKLRLFLTLVASAEARDQLEPLPNIEFNLLPGNSLIGLLHVDPAGFDPGKSGRAGEQLRATLTHETELGLTVESATAPTQKEKQTAWLAQESVKKYAALLAEKNRLVALYRKSTSITQDLAVLRAEIDAQKAAARDVLDRQLLREFQGLGIEFSQATWDAKKKTESKPERRPLTLGDIRALQVIDLPNLSGIVEKDDAWFVSRCPELGVASQGRTRTEAHKMLAEAVGLWLEATSAAEIKRRLKTGARVRPLTLAHA